MLKKILLAALAIIILFAAYIIYIFIKPVDPTTAHYPFHSPQAKAEYLAAYNKTLSKWPLPYRKVMIKTKFGPTHVLISGRKGAPPLVMLHQGAVSSTVWFPNAAGLGKHYRLYCVDVLGDINRSIPKTPPETLEQSAEWLTEVLKGLGIRRAYMIGGSYGGFVALNFTMRRPEMVKKVALLSPAASVTPISAKLMFSLIAPQVLPLRPVVRYSISSLSYLPPDKDFLDQCVTGILNTRSMLRVPPSVFSDEELGCVKPPLLLLVGDNEVIYKAPLDGIERVTRLVPLGEAEIIPNAGHLLSMDQPQLVNEAILKFFARKEHSKAILQ